LYLKAQQAQESSTTTDRFKMALIFSPQRFEDALDAAGAADTVGH
jgi:hypothetical protein